MEHDGRTDSLLRLAEIERQIADMRRELVGERTKAPPPRGKFQAVRVRVGEGEYAITSAAVREIVRYARLTTIPGCLAPVLGALNLRGERVPVLDLPRLLGAGTRPPDLRAAIVVVEVHGGPVGFLVDRVLDVATIDGDLLDAADGRLDHSRFIAAVSCAESRMLQLLDLPQLVSPTELLLLDAELSGLPAPAPAGEDTSAETADEGGWG
jgi:chemotaxis signal transduction protein